jgi:nucleotide-binding universal stress UspA family protein
MSEVILVVLGRADAAAGLLGGAGRLAALAVPARINVLAIRERIEPGGLVAEALAQEADAVFAAKERDQRRMEALKAIFDDWALADVRAGELAHWTEAEGSAAPIVGERGSRADIIVVQRPRDADDSPTRHAFRAALMGTDRPVLAIPPGFADGFGRRVAIAWRDDKRAVSAVIPALRYLAGAEEVHVLAGRRATAGRAELPRVLVEHGIRAELHALPIGSGPFGQALLDKAHGLGADMLVMGAYVHSPLREMLFGGVTHYMLANADLPLFMRH